MKKLLVAMLLFGVVGVGNAQEARPKPSPEDMQRQMEMALGSMAPMMGKMTEAMIEAHLSVLSKPESAEKMARYVKNFYDALVKQGFSKEEAFEIITSLSIPTVGQPGR